MRTAVLIYAGSLSEIALDPLGGGSSAYERALLFATKLPDLVGGLVLEGSLPLPEGPFPHRRREAWTAESVLEEAIAFVSSFSEPIGGLFILRADEALLDLGLARRMFDNYRRYRAEYSFADGYPTGLSVDIVHPRILPALRDLAHSMPGEPERGWLFSVLQKDINSFDIETEISPRDLRNLRLTLAADTRRNKLLLEGLMGAGVKDADSALAIIPEHPELQRTLPAFVQVQISGGCLQSCVLCPYPRFGGDILSRRDYMPRERFAALMKGIEAFAGDVVIDLSLWGEPSLHPEIEGLIEDVLAQPSFSLIVETSGLGWKSELFEGLAKRHKERLYWVVSLDAPSAELYASLRGSGFEEALRTADRLIELFPRTAYVQMVRSRENEESLESFWRGWKLKTDNVIIQKYSRFAGRLPERKITDLSPLVRAPCWHIKRDLSILLDGTVPLCRECVGSEIVLGRLFEGLEVGESGNGEFFARALERVWKAGAAYHDRHIRGDYPEPCAVCDEYYTYNA